MQDARKTKEPSAELNELSGRVIGAAIDVHRTLGVGFYENVYRNALVHELRKRGIKAEPEKEYTVLYDGVVVGSGNLDVLVEGVLILELKVVSVLLPIHEAQIMNYLKATGCQLGLLMNFHAEKLIDGIRRRVFTPAEVSPDAGTQATP